jgi:hypothetical protein
MVYKKKEHLIFSAAILKKLTLFQTTTFSPKFVKKYM